MSLKLDQVQLGVLRRALEARARDMHMRLGSEPGDEGFRREAALATQLLRQVEAWKGVLVIGLGALVIQNPYLKMKIEKQPVTTPINRRRFDHPDCVPVRQTGRSFGNR